MKNVDFKAVKRGKEYNVEAKGTTDSDGIRKALKSIDEKKKTNVGEVIDDGITRIGVVLKANGANDIKPSKVIVSDDFSDNTESPNRTIWEYLEFYKIFLSLVLDNSEYNKMCRRIIKIKNSKRTPLVYSRIFYLTKNMRTYACRNRKFYGYFFDQRLILQRFRTLIKELKTRIRDNDLFSYITEQIGIHKIFIGIDSEMFDALSRLNIGKIQSFTCKNEYEYQSDDLVRYLSDDGIIYVCSNNCADAQTEELFPESEVKARLRLIDGFEHEEPHECGGICRSREREGLPCRIKTYREHCHFHR